MKNKRNLDKIANIIAEHEDVEPSFMFQNNRKREVTDTRSIFHYMSAKYSQESLASIGKYSQIAGRNAPHNHASVLHGKRKVENIMQFDKKFCRKIEKIEDKVRRFIDTENYYKERNQKQVREIIDFIYEQNDDNLIDLIHKLMLSAYKSKSEESIIECITILEKAENEGIYKATQNDTSVGVV